LAREFAGAARELWQQLRAEGFRGFPSEVLRGEVGSGSPTELEARNLRRYAALAAGLVSATTSRRAHVEPFLLAAARRLPTGASQLIQEVDLIMAKARTLRLMSEIAQQTGAALMHCAELASQAESMGALLSPSAVVAIYMDPPEYGSLIPHEGERCLLRSLGLDAASVTPILVEIIDALTFMAQAVEVHPGRGDR